MTARDQQLLTTLAANWLARRGHDKRREPIRAKARELREELNLPPAKALG